MNNKVFITFNPNIKIEESTALRLQTISSLYGIAVDLPARVAIGHKDITKRRIIESGIVVCFALSKKLSSEMKFDLETAMNAKKPILVIYDKHQDDVINFNNYPYLKKVKIDYSNSNTAIDEIALFLKKTIENSTTKKTVKKTDNTPALLALLGVGVGLLALFALSKQK